MKVGIYARVSKDEAEKDNRFQNPDNQLFALRKYCENNNYEIYCEYIDKQSGADPNRPNFRLMLKEARERRFECIIVWKLDRFSREPQFVVMGYINQLKQIGCGLISITETWLDTRESNPVSELILSIMTWFAGEERRKISERTKVGIALKREQGMSWGRPKGSKDGKPRKKRGYYLKKRGVQKN